MNVDAANREAASERRETTSQGAGKVRCGEQEMGAVENASPIEAQKDEHGRPTTSGENREDVVARVLQMLNGTVNKPGETARRAANNRSG
jgi:hypothetical protein